MSFPQLLEEHGLAAGPARPYAVGRIALWSTRMDASAMSLDDLTADGVRRIAIGNPRHAPYGVRAEQVLRAAGAWDAVQDKLVLGSNIAQAVHFVQTGNADVGIVALSLLKNPNLAEAGAHHLIDDALHEPLEQGFIITRRGADKPLAEAFASHMESSLAQEILRRYGFARPGPAGDGEG